MRRLLICVLLGALLSSCGPGRPGPQPLPRLVLLGFDGMDLTLTRELLDAGQLPNLANLARQGAFVPLDTSMPPESPVAWANVLTGTRPGTHGIFDFIHRDPGAMSPYMSTSRVSPARRVEIGPLRLPLGGGQAELLRAGSPFWRDLAAAGVPARIVKAPSNFPPGEDEGAEAVSGMGTPDLLGTYGTFSLLTTDPAWEGREVKGGRVVSLRRDPDERDTCRATLEGPPHPLRADERPLSTPVELAVDGRARSALLRIGKSRTLLAEGEWSDWIPISFDILPVGHSLSGMVRALLLTTTPEIGLYLSPVNVDPLDPALPISSPEGFAGRLARRAGRYYTQGMPEDTKALDAGVLSPEQFLAQAYVVLRERERLLTAALEDFDRGFAFIYFSNPDPPSHMFWREHDPLHAAHDRADPRERDVLRDLYREVDAVVGRTVAALRPDDTLLVMSDHGFAPFSRKVHLNAWLRRWGYLAVRTEGRREGALGHIDWSKTRAYNVGFAGIYVNQSGREAEGIVQPAQRGALLAALEDGLLAAVDPDTGVRLVSRVVRTGRDLTGPLLDRGPDLIVGFASGFRNSGESALGEVPARTVEDNADRWSGDHCIDSRLVPGVLFSNRPLTEQRPSLLDLAPTVLRFFGLPIPERYVGSPVWEAPGRSTAAPAAGSEPNGT